MHTIYNSISEELRDSDFLNGYKLITRDDGTKIPAILENNNPSISSR